MYMYIDRYVYMYICILSFDRKVGKISALQYYRFWNLPSRKLTWFGTDGWPDPQLTGFSLSATAMERTMVARLQVLCFAYATGDADSYLLITDPSS